MTIFHPLFSEAFHLQDERANVIIIENGAIFFSLMNSLRQQADGKEGAFILSERTKELSVDKTLDFVGDVFSFSINERKLMTKLLSRLSEKALNEESFLHTSELMAEIEQYIAELISDFDVPIYLESPIDISMLLKAIPVSVSNSGATLVEKICDYAKLSFEFFGKQIFAFVNLKQFLSDDDILELYKFFRYEKLYLLLFEGYQKNTFDDEHILIIDKDMCII